VAKTMLEKELLFFNFTRNVCDIKLFTAVIIAQS
jgi:hypothetical protein